MGRVPTEPRYRPARDTWYVQIGGRQVTLAKGKANKKAARARLRELMDEAERPAAETPSVPAVGKLVLEYMKDLKRRRDAGELSPSSRRDAIRRLAGFTVACGHLPADQIRQHHVLAWLDTRRYVPPHPKDAPAPEPRPIGATSRHDAIGAVKAVFGWAERAGFIERDPLKGLKKPERNPRRERVMSADQWPKVRAAILSDEFRDLADFLFETGARPGEAFRLEARHLDLPRKVAVLSAKEHKSGRKTKATRPIHLSEAAADIVARLAKKHPEDEIFRSAGGAAWNKNSVNCQVRRVRKRAGVGGEFVAYALRHLFATDALDNDVPIATVAGLLGHKDTRMVGTVYSRLDERHEHFSEAVGKVRNKPKP